MDKQENLDIPLGLYDVYLSGTIMEHPDYNFAAFRNAAEILRGLGYTVFNPIELHNGIVDKEYSEYLRPGMEALLNTRKALVVLPGWEDGVGSKLEVATACAIGLPVHEFHQKMGLGETLYSTHENGREQVREVFSIGRSLRDELDNPIELPHEEAARVVLGPRGAYYDHPLDNFIRTAHIWTGILYSKLKEGEAVSAEDVSLCMNGVKIAREAFRHKRDNLVDGHGYWMTLNMLLEERARREEQKETENVQDIE